MKMLLGNYLISLTTYPATGKTKLEVNTRLDVVSKLEYTKIVKVVMSYMGREGFFDASLPSTFYIYDRAGNVVNIENAV